MSRNRHRSSDRPGISELVDRLLPLVTSPRDDSFVNETLARIDRGRSEFVAATTRRIQEKRQQRRTILVAGIGATFGIVALILFASRSSAPEPAPALTADRGETRIIPRGESDFATAPDHSKARKHYQLESGRIDLDVAPQKGSLRVSTPHLTATVIGTSFSVETDLQESSVAVAEGKVRVAASGLDFITPLGPGEGIEVDASDRIRRRNTISRLSAAPTVDGKRDRIWAETPVFSTESNDRELGMRWRAGWTQEALHLFVVVADDAAVSAGTRRPYLGDCIEIFLDPDLSGGKTYDGVDDFEFFLPYGEKEVSANKFSPRRSLESIESVSTKTPRGWTIETMIPFSLLGYTPARGAEIGFDIALDDQDSESPDAPRRARISWNDKSNQSWKSAAVFGRLILSE